MLLKHAQNIRFPSSRESKLVLCGSFIDKNTVIHLLVEASFPPARGTALVSRILGQYTDFTSKGFLTGDIRKQSDIPDGYEPSPMALSVYLGSQIEYRKWNANCFRDMRHMLPRFQGENFQKNLKLVDDISKIAKQNGCTPGQLALAWVSSLSKQVDVAVIPIPGATTAERVAENSKMVTLTADELVEIDSVLKSFTVSGQRYGEAQMAHIDTS